MAIEELKSWKEEFIKITRELVRTAATINKINDSIKEDEQRNKFRNLPPREKGSKFPKEYNEEQRKIREIISQLQQSLVALRIILTSSKLENAKIEQILKSFVIPTTTNFPQGGSSIFIAAENFIKTHIDPLLRN